MIYKAIEGTTMYDAFEDKLIFGECIERIARERTYCDGVMHYEFESRQDVYNQIREATNQEMNISTQAWNSIEISGRKMSQISLV